MVYAANSDEPVGGRYFVKAVGVALFSSVMTIYYTDSEAISDAGQVSYYDILAKHPLVAVGIALVKFILEINALPLLQQ